jgi:predicted dithiol-disulfide oxidoreductase (DUF899 family)
MKSIVVALAVVLSYGVLAEDLEAMKKQRNELDIKIAEMQNAAPPVEFKDYALKDAEGKEVKLSAAFGDQKHLIVVLNMGAACEICNAYAAQYKGAVDEKGQINLMGRQSAFCLLTVDEPATVKASIEKRGWKFPIFSAAGTTILKDLGYEQDGQVGPGITLLKKEGDKIWIVKQRKYFGGDRILGLLDTVWLVPAPAK